MVRRLVEDLVLGRVQRLGDQPPHMAAAGAWIGWDWVDPVVGLAITVAILVVLRDAARQAYRRLRAPSTPPWSTGPRPPCVPCPACRMSVPCGCGGSATGCTPKPMWS